MKNQSAIISQFWLFAVLLLPGATPGRDTRIDPADCRTLHLEDKNGRPVIGTEDIVPGPSGQTLYISAYDRRAVEREADNGAVVTQGGIYRATLSSVVAGGHLQVETVIDSQAAGGPMRPHGIDVWSSARGELYLAAINRLYRDKRRSERHDIIQTFFVDKQSGKADLMSTLPEDGRLCSPNDLALASEQLVFISNDHGACGGLEKMWEDTWGLSQSRLYAYQNGNYEPVGPAVAFANGVALIRDQSGKITNLALSATRDHRVMLFDTGDGDACFASVAPEILELSAAPDNITVTPDRELYVAAHPNLLRYALYRAGLSGVKRAPSLVYRIHHNPVTGWQHAVVFEDDGGLISGATVALAANGQLIIGSAYDDHLLVCSLEAK
ncbi:MAG: hypothetical protein ABFS24_10955 [Pseudomonadota bacterium]